MNQNGMKNYNEIFGIKEEKKKSLPWLFITCVALALAVIILLSVFLSSYLGTVRLVSRDGGTVLLDKRHEVEYLLAPMCYEPIRYGEVYARHEGVDFYTVMDADPREYLCTIDMNVYDIYYASTVTLPTLEEFDPEWTVVCRIEVEAVQTGSVNEEDTKALIDYYLAAEAVEKPSSKDTETVLYFKFMSQKYPFLFYSINYYVTKDGARYLYDRPNGRCVLLGDDFKDIVKK